MSFFGQAGSTVSWEDLQENVPPRSPPQTPLKKLNIGISSSRTSRIGDAKESMAWRSHLLSHASLDQLGVLGGSWIQALQRSHVSCWPGIIHLLLGLSRMPVSTMAGSTVCILGAL